jgi:glycosyltransferase involved in cell wall biosynthesis
LKKVLFFTSSHKIGLTSLLSDEACHINKKAGSRFLFLSGEGEQFSGLFHKLESNGVAYGKIAGLDKHSGFFQSVREFKRHVDSFSPIFVHVQTNWQLAISLATRLIYRRKYAILYTIHGYRHNYRYRSIIAGFIIGVGLLLFSDTVIVPCSFLKSKFSLIKNKTDVLFLGIDDEFFTDYNPPFFNGTKRIAFPGEFREGKNQDTLIRALKKYIDKTGDSNVELYLPGGGKKLEGYKRLVSQLGLEERVFFPGFLTRNQIIELYRKCQFAIVPSNVETFGLCIAEPFVLGRVVISRHVGVADDIITHGENGFLYDTEEELVELLVKVLPDEEKCTMVARKAFDGRDVFRWSSLTEKYLALIDRSFPS